ncbi:MAG: ABC transporter ATP-binding protein [Spirochaetota bacterium]
MTWLYSLEARGLTFGYTDSPVLNELTLAVRPGELVGILGPNGCGKTTLLKNLLRYLKPVEGSVTIFDGETAVDANDLSSQELARLAALVPQRSGGGATLTVYEMVMLGRLPHMESRWTGFTDADRDIVECTLAGLRIDRFRNRQCSTLSGGEFQKVLLARALVQDSDILVLDEATANLDMHHAVELMDLVRDRLHDNRTVIAVMHDLNLAAAYCDRVVFVKNGAIRYEGPPARTFTTDVIRDIYDSDLYVGRDDHGVPFVLPRAAAGGVRTSSGTLERSAQ